MRSTRYALLASTMLLPGLALPHWSAAAPLSVSSTQGPIILAQAGAVDPKEKEKEKAKQLQKGVPPQPKGAPQAVAPPSPPQPPTLPQQKIVPSTGTQQGLQNVQPPTGSPQQRVVPQLGTQQGLQNVQPPAGSPQQKKVVPQLGTQQGLQNVQPPTGTPQQKVLPQPGTQQGLQSVQPPTGAAGLPKGPAPAGLQKPLPGQPGQITGTPQNPQVLQQQKQILQPQGIGTVDALRSQRREQVEGKTVIIREPGNRVIVRENGRAFIRHDETQRFSIWGQPRIEHRGQEQYAYITRPGGYQIVTVTDSSGRLLRRVRRGPDGREFVLIDNRPRFGVGAAMGAGFAAGVILGLAAPVITIPRERYIVDVSAAPPALLYETLEAPPLVEIERPYSLDEIRYNVALRDRMRRIDIDSITFDSGSWEVAPEQYPRLQAIAEAMGRILAHNPNEMILLEGHTDAVGTDVDNLSLSDRRAESVAVILTNVYQIPPENLVTQGYGEQHLKVPTDGPSRENRRVSARRITPLLQGQLASR